MEKGKEAVHKKNVSYYLGLDIGTDSVGYAVTDEKYNLLRFHGQDAWGTHIFDQGNLNAERRSYRGSRRRLDRRKQRVALLQELFADEIGKIDESFFRRIQESYLFRSDCEDKFILFNDETYTDTDYYNQYPTIHHLISELMNNKEPHDVRLVYLACAWLVAHRGHFFSNIGRDNLDTIKEFNSVYSGFMSFFSENGYSAPWEDVNQKELENVLREKTGVNGKYKGLVEVLYKGKKPEKLNGEEIDEEFPFSREGITKLLAGGTYSLRDLFGKDEYDSLETKSVSLSMDDDKLAGIMSDIGEDYELIAALRSLSDWAVLVDVLGDNSTISAAKVSVYERHEKDLRLLKNVIRKYIPDKYDEVFRDTDKCNYAGYVYHSDEEDTSKLKKRNKEDFSKYILSVIKDVVPDNEDEADFNDMVNRLGLQTFMPKQKNTDNRVIPHQLFWYELHAILCNAANYLGFLSMKDNNGLTVSEKIESVFLFRVPYFVGPLNRASSNAWFVRKAEGKIYPWDFEDKVDLDASEEEFIKRLTNTCTYIPGEPVIPKDSLLYHKFTVLNEINNLRINGERISVELKQSIYNDLFLQKKKVTKKALISWLICNGYITKGSEDVIFGIDEEIKSNLVPQIAFRRLLESHTLSEADVERIIERASYAEDKLRLSKWLVKEYPELCVDDRKYICSLKIKDFGRLSRYLLCEIEGADCITGEVTTVIGALWNTQNNLMEILADSSKFTFKQELEDYQKEYYAEHSYSLEQRLDDMYLSNTVKRQVYRTIDIVKDVNKAFGAPKKIFVEMTRGADADKKGKRTLSRKQQILDLYKQCRDEDVRLLKQQLEAMGDYAENKLQGDKLFLYYMQLGKSMYSGKPIDLERLGNSAYCDIDHIYPQAYVKDDSIINNKVLVFSEENGAKSDIYPIADNIRHSQWGFWKQLRDCGLMSEEKFKRLTRATAFSDEEKYGFINRQITETSQSTKAVATLLKEYFPNTEIVYSKARLTSEFRQEFDLVKSRAFNDLHHAVDAYLNIVTGNVYNMKFTKNFRVDRPYSIKTSTVFTHPVISGGVTIWDGTEMLANVKRVAAKNTAHFTKYSFMKKGGLFDQMPVPADGGLVPLKKDRPSEKYGGYNRPGIMFFIPVKYFVGKKSDIIIMPVELLYGERFLSDKEFAEEYAHRRLKHILGKDTEKISFPMGNHWFESNVIL